MDEERLRRIESVFHAVADLPADGRESILVRLCDGDEEVEREVRSLLAADKESDGLLDRSHDSIVRDSLGSEARASSTESGIQPGAAIGQYVIGTLVGEGGMGQVFLARDGRLERDVAIKFLTGELSADDKRRERFFREAKSASALNHPNILTVHEIGDHGDSHYIVTEFVRGETLKSRLVAGRIEPDEAIALALQIASALAAAHAAGIVHRDIKPDNVMIRDDGIVKVLDFGIAKLDPSVTSDVDAEAETRVGAATLPGMIVGTPQYMSPEQARGLRVDSRSDIFSFGVVLYEMLSGEAPFRGATNMDILGSVLKDDPEPLNEVIPDVSAELARIVEKTLRKDREMRYQHIRDLMIDLGDARKTLESEPVRRHRTTAEITQVTGDHAMVRSSLPTYALSAALVVVAAIAGYFMLRPAAHSSTVSDIRTAEVANWSSTPGETYSVGSLSPDARTIAFSSSRSGSMNIWVKQAASGEAVQITKDDGGNRNPIWSPNGEEIAYFSTKGGQSAIWRIPRLGGSAQIVKEVPDRGTRPRFWSKTDRIYYDAGGELYMTELTSLMETKLTELAGRGIRPRSLYIAPNESSIAFIDDENNKSAIWVTDINKTAPRKIFESDEQIKNLAWHADGNRLFFSATDDGTFQIFATDTAGSEPRQLTKTENDSLVLDSSLDGTKVLFGTAKEESDLWSVEIATRKETAFAANIDSEFWPDVSPDGKLVAYESVKNLSQGNKIFNGILMIAPESGTDPGTQLVTDACLPKFSPDGRTIAYAKLVGNKLKIETIPVSGGNTRRVSNDGVAPINFTVLPYNRINGADFSWSPDSRQIAYVSDAEENANVWLAAADGSTDTRVTDFGIEFAVSSPIWSPDGKKIAFLTKTNNLEGRPTFSVSLFDVETKRIDPIWSENSFIRLIGWSANGESMFLGIVTRGALSGMPDDVTLSRLDVAAKKAVETATLPDAYVHNMHLSPDHQTLAFAANRDGKDDIWILPVQGGAPKQVTSNNDPRRYFSSIAWAPDGKRIFFGKQSRFSLLSLLTNFD